MAQTKTVGELQGRSTLKTSQESLLSAHRTHGFFCMAHFAWRILAFCHSRFSQVVDGQIHARILGHHNDYNILNTFHRSVQMATL